MLNYKHLPFFNTHISGKLRFFILLYSVLPVMLMGYYSYYSTTQLQTSNILVADKQNVESLVDTLEDFLGVVPNHLGFLANFHALDEFLQRHAMGEPEKTKPGLKNTTNVFDSFIAYNQIYWQLQVINPQGQELLRILNDNHSDKTIIVAVNELQNRQDTEYFTNTIDLKKGEILMSNWQRVDEKKIAQEYQPVIRYSAPIVDKNHVTQGILVLSLSADTILDILHEENSRLNNKHSHYHLINHTGEYLSHPFDNKKGGRQSAHDALLTPPALFATLADKPHGTITTNGIITTFQKIYPLRGATSSFKKFPPQSGQKDGQVFWVLVKQTDKNAALTKLPYFQYVFFGAIILVVIVVLIITHWFIKTFVEPLLLVNQHLKALAQGKLIEDHIKYHKTNEMGHLVLYVWQLKNSFKNTITQANAIAAGDYSRNVILLSEQDQLGQALSHMTRTLREVTAKNVMQDWLKTGQTQLNEQMSGDQDIAQLTQNIIDFLTNYLQAQIGLLYLVEGDEDYLQQNVRLSLIASYAYTRCQNSANEFRFGEGLVGQAAKEQQSIIVTQVPEDYIHIQSGLGDAVPRNILVVPFMYETVVKGVVEIGSFSELTEIQREFLNLVAPGIGIAINTTQSHAKMQELLQQTQTQTEELQSQAEELQTQQEELRQANEELEERTIELEQQKDEIRDKNIALSKTQLVIETKAKEVELASQYKSEFLANMSHELRTPLNSLLILAQLLIKNKDGNLSNKQVEYARTMHSAGSDLLVLINDILDLSKVEAGKMGINKEDVLLAEIVETIDDKFRPIAINKGLAFHITIAQYVPPVLCTDAQRLKQIINNLLSNAFKFTKEGEIRLEIGQSSSKSPLSQTGDSTLSLQRVGGYLPKTRLEPAKTIAFSVTDTGIGIPEEKQKLIFKAFQQADGTTSRHYGGTGLGLSISRQLAQLLGGEIQLLSEEGKGCTFTLYLPESISDTQKTMSSEVQEIRIPLLSQTDETSRATTSIETVAQVVPSQLKGNNPTEPGPEKPENSEEIVDDSAFLKSEDQSLLIIEDDRQFSRILMELAREKDFKCIIAEDGKTGLQLAKQYLPNAIILDVGLPQVDGWTVMERLKENPETRHIPVHFISAFDQSMDAKKMGAIGYLHKPVNMEQLEEAFKKIEQFIAKTVKNLLVVVDNELHQQNIVDLVESDEIQTTLAVTLAAALQHLKIAAFDCIILDADIEHSTGIQLLDQLRHEDDLSQIPVIIYANRDLNLQEEGLLQHCADNLTIKTVRSPERLLDEVTLFLHQIEANLSTDKRDMLRMVHDKTAILKHRKVLIVDDDVRNVFALATVLEDKDMDVVIGTNGKEALELLEEHQDIALVLMDIMMPEMDGYEATRKIRQQPHLCKLPIIALTAKAMKSDKAKCIEAGANDYLSKPVDTDKLISLMRVWLYR